MGVVSLLELLLRRTAPLEIVHVQDVGRVCDIGHVWVLAPM